MCIYIYMIEYVIICTTIPIEKQRKERKGETREKNKTKKLSHSLQYQNLFSPKKIISTRRIIALSTNIW